MTPVNRRIVLGAGAGLPLAATLVACGADESGPSTTAAPEVPKGELIGRAQDVPVGGCAVFQDSKVVVTQPAEGEFRAFSAVCTHQQCVVSSAPSGDIPCRCHQSFFSPRDGAVVSGPAKSPLPAVEITVEGDELRAV